MPRRSQLALAGAAAVASALAPVWLAAVHVGPVHRLDAAILSGFTGLDGPLVRPFALFFAQLCDPHVFVWFAAALVIVALLRRRPRTAVAVAVVLLAANVTTQLLKPALATPRHSPPLEDAGQIVAASWPSGHATAAMAIALCLILVAPARLRPWAAAVGALFAVAVTFSLLTLGWHYPSDVLGGLLVATASTLTAVGVVWWTEARWPRREAGDPAPPVREALAPTGVAALSAALLGGVVLVARPGQVVAYAQQHTTFVVGAGLLGAAALALAAALTLLVLRGPRR
jgi:membrane-associated phospholipid phosphatase